MYLQFHRATLQMTVFKRSFCDMICIYMSPSYRYVKTYKATQLFSQWAANQVRNCGRPALLCSFCSWHTLRFWIGIFSSSFDVMLFTLWTCFFLCEDTTHICWWQQAIEKLKTAHLHLWLLHVTCWARLEFFSGPLWFLVLRCPGWTSGQTGKHFQIVPLQLPSVTTNLLYPGSICKLNWRPAKGDGMAEKS